MLFILFFFNDTATTEIYTLSLHDALPIFVLALLPFGMFSWVMEGAILTDARDGLLFNYPLRIIAGRSEEHTSELQSRLHLVCRLLLEKKKTRARYRLHSPSPQSVYMRRWC